MKKKTKSLLFLTSIISIPVFINYLIFRNTNKNNCKTEESYYDWRFGKIRYITIGSGEPLLLIHDLSSGSSLDEWEKNIQQLSKHYKVYAIDLLGYGKSEKPRISYSSYLYISLINDFIEDVVKSKVNIIASGSSSGYAVMANSFSKDIIKKILIISPKRIAPIKIIQSKYNSFKKFLLESPVIGTSIYNIINSKVGTKIALEKKYFDTKQYVTKNLIKKIYLESHNKGASCKFPYSSYVFNYLDVDIRNKLKYIDIPVQIVWGNKDYENPISNMNYLDKDCKNVKLIIFNNTKSYPHIEKPLEFYKVCRKFFGKSN